MAFNYGKVKAAGVPKSFGRVAKLVKDRKLKTPSFDKVKAIKDKMPKAINFSKMTKLSKLPKAPKIALIKKAIKKAAKPKGF